VADKKTRTRLALWISRDGEAADGGRTRIDSPEPRGET